jgi:hypothetical protein
VNFNIRQPAVHQLYVYGIGGRVVLGGYKRRADFPTRHHFTSGRSEKSLTSDVDENLIRQFFFLTPGGSNMGNLWKIVLVLSIVGFVACVCDDSYESYDLKVSEQVQSC